MPVHLDFGPDDGTNGNATASPDPFGNTWNNVTGPTAADLLDVEGNATGIDVQFTTNFSSNGINHGGLLAPDPALLGEFAVATATQDYFFASGGTISFKLKDLDPARTYTLRFFGTRETTLARTTRYTATGGGTPQSVDLDTSGIGIGDGGYDGNNDTIVELRNVAPDSGGEILIDVTAQAGGFGYLGELSVEMNDEPAAVTRWVRQDLVDPPGPGAVLFLGSSSIRRWEDLHEAFADYRILQRGFGGAQLEEVNAVIDRIVVPYQPSAVVMWAGTNDLNSGEPAAEVVADFQAFVSEVQVALPTVEVLYLGITRNLGNDPTMAERLSTNSQIETICQGDARLHYVDLPAFFENLSTSELENYYVDAIHLNRTGYEEWRKIVRPALEAVVAPNRSSAVNPSAPQDGARLLFDLGPDNPVDGDRTSSPDGSGLHWNSWPDAIGGAAVNAGERLAGLVDAAGAATGVRLTVTGGFASNGKVNGGLDAPDGPDPLLLGDLAVETATQDYFFSTADGLVGGSSDDVPGGLALQGLDPVLEYELRFFGSRATTSTRRVEFAVSGDNSAVVEQQTSGTDIGSDGAYDGNDDDVAVVSGIRPNAFGDIFIDMTVLEGGFGYLNAFELRVSQPVSGIALWRESHFAPADLGDPSKESTVWGVGADPDGDGLVNLWEYYHDLDPLVGLESRTTAAGPLMPVVVAVDPKLVIHYVRPETPPADVGIEVLTGGDPGALVPVAEGVDFAESTGAAADGWVPVSLEFTQGAPDLARQFMALRATIQP